MQGIPQNTSANTTIPRDDDKRGRYSSCEEPLTKKIRMARAHSSPIPSSSSSSASSTPSSAISSSSSSIAVVSASTPSPRRDARTSSSRLHSSCNDLPHRRVPSRSDDASSFSSTREHFLPPPSRAERRRPSSAQSVLVPSSTRTRSDETPLLWTTQTSTTTSATRIPSSPEDRPRHGANVRVDNIPELNRNYRRSVSCPPSSSATNEENASTVRLDHSNRNNERNDLTRCSYSSVPDNNGRNANTSVAIQTNNAHGAPSATTSSPPSADSSKNSNDKTNSNNSNKNNNSTSSNDADHRTSKDYYFDSYGHHGIHEEMLKDEVRTRAYETAILENAHLFQDRVVLDVGCGTGILCLFAAQAGAKRVYGVECSDIVRQAARIVEKNGFSDKITLLQGRVEDIELPVADVDIIISEWMGYFLLYESMLDTVLYARDKWLYQRPKDEDNDSNDRPDGLLFPDRAVVYLCAAEDARTRHERIDFWDNVYGFDMSPIKEIARSEPVVDVVDARRIVSTAAPVLELDLHTCTAEDASFSSDFCVTATRNDYVHGLVAYFECFFSRGVRRSVRLSTSPFDRYTHWKQTMFYLPGGDGDGDSSSNSNSNSNDDSVLTVCAGEEIRGRISCRPNERNRRDLDISVRVEFRGRHSGLECDMEYKLR